MAESNPKQILIIGGGLSGLALGQVLRANSIPFSIYERDHDAGSRTQGWAITLRDVLAPMYNLFPKDMPPLSPSVNVLKGVDLSSPDPLPTFGAVHCETGEVLGLVAATSREEDINHHWIRASRAEFRHWLMTNLDGHLHWGKQCVGYSETAYGVTAHFADGSSADGALLVAADGANSKVRAQLIGADNIRMDLAPIGAIAADTTLSRVETDELLLKGSAFFTSMGPDYQFFMGVRGPDTATDRTSVYWSITWDQTREGETMQERPHGAQAKHFALERTKGLHASVRKYIESTKPEEFAQEAPALKQWSAESAPLGGRRVTLMGDALHTMTPFRGLGANTAIQDAFEIAQLILQAQAKGRDIADLIGPYEAMAVPRGKARVQLSRTNGLSADTYSWINNMKRAFHAGWPWEPLPDKL